jgi:DNA primase
MNTYQILREVDILEVITDYIKINTSTDPTDIRALCPFHNDKNPSLSIDNNKQVYYCFGCHAGGNALTFIQEIENVSKEVALQILIKKAGIEIEQLPELDLLSDINDYYKSQLSEVSSYIHERELQYGIAKDLELGYSGEDAFDLAKNFQGHIETLAKLGLLQVKYKGTPQELVVSTFTNRLMFPIRTELGVIAFTGRTLIGHDSKYINNHETEHFKRRKILYGFHKAKEFIKSYDFALLVEGFLDVGRAWSKGYAGTVSSLGTGITEEQVNLLGRVTKNVYICLDGDDAGKRATKKTLFEFMKAGFNVNVIELPDKEDPDSYFLKYDEIPDGIEGVQYLKEKVSEEDFRKFLDTIDDYDRIPQKYFSIYNIMKENITKSPVKKFNVSKVINSDPLFQLALLLEADPTLHNEVDSEILDKIMEKQSDPGVIKIIKTMNPYANIPHKVSIVHKFIEML